MGKFHRFYKNVSGSTIYVQDMNNWEIKADAEVDLELVPEDLLSRSIHFGKLIALNRLVALPDRVTAAATAAPPPTFLTPDVVRQIAREVGVEIAKAMLKMHPANLPGVAPAPATPQSDGQPRGQAAREEIDHEVDEARIRLIGETIADRAVSLGGGTAEVVDHGEDTTDIVKPLEKVVGKRRGAMPPGIRKDR